MPTNFLIDNLGKHMCIESQSTIKTFYNLEVDFEANISFLPLTKHLRSFFLGTILGYIIEIQVLKFHKINCLFNSYLYQEIIFHHFRKSTVMKRIERVFRITNKELASSCGILSTFVFPSLESQSICRIPRNNRGL